MADVADEIGISRASLYNYFHSRDELIDAILKRMTEQLLSPDAALFTRPGHGIALSLRIARRSPHAYLLLIRFAAGEPQYASYRDAYHKVILERTLDRAARFFGDARAPFLRRVAAQSVIAFIESSVANWIETGSEIEDPQFIAWGEQALGALFREWGYDVQKAALRQSA
ncbi:MAG: TetR/AcrR family transcriptional regulator [Nevskiales bacterium]|nr:TetR/AcrR family transcriptional regulator [Verrucomicrobiales bacterium]MCI0749598.1 TetR/AcrR family transcriptional regulator [Nevskiales bacterium]